MRGRLSLVTVALLLSPARAVGQGAIPMDGRWTLTGEGSQIRTVEGRPVIQLATGVAALEDLRLRDGTIDVDVRFPDQRSFVYLIFRVEGEGEQEEMYLRPHKSMLPDAIQYAPVFQGASAWQFYHGPGGTAAIPLPPDRWIRVRLVLQGRQAALFVGDTVTPVMVVPRLAREPAAGSLALRSFMPAPVPPGVYGAQFANLVVRPDDIRYRFRAAEAPTLPRGIVTTWGVGRAFVPDTGARQGPHPETLTGGLRSVPVEPDKGFVLLHRHVRVPDGLRRVGVVAKLSIQAASAGLRRFNLGFSDQASVYLNGQLLFSGDASYSFDEPRRDGLIGLDQASLYLSLRAGANELTVVVVDSFGGWGLMGQFEDPTGLVVRPRG